jgi:hypothetical protein
VWPISMLHCNRRRAFGWNEHVRCNPVVPIG